MTNFRGMPIPSRDAADSAPSSRRDAGVMAEHRIRRRSVGFLERQGERWACFLVTHPDADGGWRGHLAFRPSEGQEGGDEVSTTGIFVEENEGDILQKARALGRPLLLALLESALHTLERERGTSPFLQRWFKRMLADHALPTPLPRVGSGEDASGAARDSEAEVDASSQLAALRSVYASYRVDQVAHFISLVNPDDFQQAVLTVLDGQAIDFGARDRLQLAMLVVERIEASLPLPPFEVWVRDFISHRDEYERYAWALHRGTELP